MGERVFEAGVQLRDGMRIEHWFGGYVVGKAELRAEGDAWRICWKDGTAAGPLRTSDEVLERIERGTWRVVGGGESVAAAAHGVVSGAHYHCPSGDTWTVAVRGDQLRLERGKLAMPWLSPAELAAYLDENRFELLPTWEQARRWIDEVIARSPPAHAESFAYAMRHLGERAQDTTPPTRRFIQATASAINAAEARLPEPDAVFHASEAFGAAMGGMELWWIAGAAVDLYLARRAAS